MRARTSFVLVLTAFLALLTATTASAARNYWTSERMRLAIPADRVHPGSPPDTAAKGGTPGKPGGGGGGGGGGGSTTYGTFMAPIDKLSLQPVSTNGRVFFKDGAFNYSCSGTSVAASNRSVVLTAGHCVNEGPGAYYGVANWIFVPGYNDGASPTGQWQAIQLLTTSGWRTQGEFGVDVGAAVVAKKNGQALADAVGARPVSTTSGYLTDYTSHGYPAERKYDGRFLWVSATKRVYTDGSTSPATMGISTDFNGGSSGGGWVLGAGTGDTGAWNTASAPVVSVNSYTYRSLKNVMFGPHLESAAAQLISDAGAVSVN